MHTITRLLEIDAGHRLMNHESKCSNVHGHRYRFEVTCSAEALDAVGRVVDFGVIKELVGGWLDANWDHGFIYERGDAIGEAVALAGHKVFMLEVPPSAENMVTFVHQIAESLLVQHGLTVTNVRCYETPNCFADSMGVR